MKNVLLGDMSLSTSSSNDYILMESLYPEVVNQENIILRKHKVKVNKQQCLDRKQFDQWKLVISDKSKDNIGINAKRSVKMSYKRLDRTPFKTTNLGRKRLNSRYIFEEQN